LSLAFKLEENTEVSVFSVIFGGFSVFFGFVITEFDFGVGFSKKPRFSVSVSVTDPAIMWTL
jgi:hypothetical protein